MVKYYSKCAMIRRAYCELWFSRNHLICSRNLPLMQMNEKYKFQGKKEKLKL